MKSADFLVGDTDPAGYVVLPRPPRRDAASVREALVAFKVPADWWDHCDVTTSAIDGSPIQPEIDLRIGWPDPARPLDDLARAVDLGLGLAIHPQAELDLSTLGLTIAEAPRLRIGGLRRVAGWAVLASAKAERAVIGGASEPVPPMPNARVVNAVGGNAAGAAASPKLKFLTVDLMGEAWPEGVAIGPSVASIQIIGARRLNEVPPLSEPLSLRTFRIDGAPGLDLGGLRKATNLTWVDLSRIASVTSFDALAHAASLAELELSGVRHIDSWMWLGDSSIERVVVESSVGMPQALADDWMARHSGWWIRQARAR